MKTWIIFPCVSLAGGFGLVALKLPGETVMSRLNDIPAGGLALVLVAAILFAMPSIIAQWRRVRAFRSISALNGLLVFTFVCGFFLDNFWLGWWATAALWVLTMVWAMAGAQRDA